MVAAKLAFGRWLWWASREQVTLCEIPAQARVELDAATYPIHSPLLGRVVETKLLVVQTVRRGEVLVEIDATPDQFQLREEQVSARGLELELARALLQNADFVLLDESLAVLDPENLRSVWTASTGRLRRCC